MRIHLIASCALVVVASFSVRDLRAASVSDFADFSLRSGTTTLLPGRLFVPPAAVSDPGIARPLILFLHGAGESGMNNLAQINGNLDNLLAEAKRRSAFLYAPQTNGGWSSATITDRVMTMIDRALSDQPVDNTRLYATGLSMGGGGVWNMLNRYPDLFAAGVPICGVSPAGDFVPSRLTDQAIAAFHARNDSVVSVSASRNVINRILTAGQQTLPTYPPLGNTMDFIFSAPNSDLNYIEFATGGHGIWPAVYNEPLLYDWMFSHATVPEPATLVSASLAAVALFATARRRRSATAT